MTKIVSSPANHCSIVFECEDKMPSAIYCCDIALCGNGDVCFTVGVFAPGIDSSINSECKGIGGTRTDIFEAHVFEIGGDGSRAMAIVTPCREGIVIE